MIVIATAIDLSATGRVRTIKHGAASLIYAVYESYVKIMSLRTTIKGRGRGEATALMNEFIDAVADKPIFLDCSPLDRKTNTDRLIKFYMSFGFRRTGKTVNAYGDPEMVLDR